MIELDLTTALSTYFEGAAANSDRGDEDAPHVSDLADCDRAVWARRKGLPRLGFSDDTRVKFELGHAVENFIATALTGVLAIDGWVLERDVVVDLSGVVGHVDYVLRRGDECAVVEVKSTTFFPQRQPNGSFVRVPPTAPQYHYTLQAAAYALALDAPRFCILVVCRDTGMIAEFWRDTARHRTEVMRRVDEVLVYTDPEMSMPPATPPAYANGKRGNWRCRYCKFTGCEKNPFYDEAETEAPL